MKQVCISSDITASHLTVSYTDLLDIKSLNLQFLNDETPIFQLREAELDIIKEEIESRLSSLLLNRKDKSDTNIRAEYRKKVYEFNFRDKHDFHIYTLVCVHEIVVSCLGLEGTLFLYNQELFRKFRGDSIVAYLRVKGGLGKEKLFDGIGAFQSQLKQSNTIAFNTLEEGLKILQRHGMIQYNVLANEYNLTARGYMFW
jgi:hypothetical protein